MEMPAHERCAPMPDEAFKQALSDAANAAQAFAPSATHVRRELGKLLADVVRLENEANRIVRTLRRLQPMPHDR